MKLRKFCVLVFLWILLGCNGSTEQLIFIDCPKFDKAPVTDNYFGTFVVDGYRNMENVKDSMVTAWFKAQSEHTKTYLDTLQIRSLLVNQMQNQKPKNNSYPTYIRYADNGFGFYLKSDSESTSLYYKKHPYTEERLLLNPVTFQTELNREYTISYYRPSWDGKHVLVALSYDGITGTDLVIVDVLNQKMLPQIITNADPEYFLGISWLPDSSGFLYLYIPDLDDNSDRYMKNSSTVLYRLGEDPDKRHIIFSAYNDENLSEDDLPIAKVISPNDRYLIGYQASSENYWNAYYADMDQLEIGNLKWKPFYTKEEKIYADYGYFMDDRFVFISAKNADNRTISSFDMDDIDHIKQTVLAPEKKNEVMTSLVIADNRPYYTTTKFGVESFLYGVINGTDTKIQLPNVAGTIDMLSPSNDNTTLWIGLDGWTQDYTRYQFSNGLFKKEPLSSNHFYPEFEDFVTKEITVTSHDGVEVPLSLIYRKDVKKNGSTPAFIYTYGAYGESITPFFSPIMLNWVHNGGIWAIPHIRGGGEKGEAWHRQGMKTLKYNSWKDIIACTEYLISERYTSKSKTVLYSSSAGAVSTGMAVNEEPELFKVFIADVPMLNPLRNEVRKRNGSNYMEYGTVKDSTECMGLIAMDPYINLKKDTPYPATLILSGYNDARIDLWIPGKYAAKLQEYNSSYNPVFLDIVYDTGHSGGDTTDERISEYAKIFAFAFWQTNYPIKN